MRLAIPRPKPGILRAFRFATEARFPNVAFLEVLFSCGSSTRLFGGIEALGESAYRLHAGQLARATIPGASPSVIGLAIKEMTSKGLLAVLGIGTCV